MDRSSLIGLNRFKEKNGVLIIEAPTPHKANEITLEILEKYCDLKTALFLSGGKTPIPFYKDIAAKKSLRVGAVGLVDERFGKKLHKNSNELMIKNTGLLDYFEAQNIRFYPIIGDEEGIERSTQQYDETLRFILKYFPKSVGILGIGADGHTAGLPAEVKSQNSKGKSLGSEITKRILEDQSSLATFYELEGYGVRITMTFQALEMLDLVIVLVLGQEKREALKLMFEGGFEKEDIEKIPARFYLRPEIAAKTILITDQII